MEVYIDKMYTPIAFGDAAPSVLVFYRVKGHILVDVLFLWKYED